MKTKRRVAFRGEKLKARSVILYLCRLNVTSLPASRRHRSRRFQPAAERLDLSQSAVSQTIANLEHRLGTSLACAEAIRRGRPRPAFGYWRFAQKRTLNEEREAARGHSPDQKPARCRRFRLRSRRPRIRASVLRCSRNSASATRSRDSKSSSLPAAEIVHGVAEGPMGTGIRTPFITTCRRTSRCIRVFRKPPPHDRARSSGTRCVGARRRSHHARIAAGDLVFSTRLRAAPPVSDCAMPSARCGK